jgi:hypothetical protein
MPGFAIKAGLIDSRSYLAKAVPEVLPLLCTICRTFHQEVHCDCAQHEEFGSFSMAQALL